MTPGEAEEGSGTAVSTSKSVNLTDPRTLTALLHRAQALGLSRLDAQLLLARATGLGRTALLAQLHTLVQAVNAATGEQRAAIEVLVDAAGSVMQTASERFAQVLDSQARLAQDSVTQVGSSAVELASLGDAFGQSVQQFQVSNQQLVQGLQRIEQSLNRSTARSDEQLAYYVAQAREVIDLSIASQAGLIEQLRQLQPPPGRALAEGDRA